MSIAELIYLLCAATSLTAAALLIRRARRRRTRLLLWSSVAFAGLGLNNVLLYVDLVLFTGADLALPRSAVGVAAMIALVYGLVSVEPSV
jgi:hypothetical protein